MPLERMPVYVRAGGSVIPTQPEVSTTPEGPPTSLTLLAQAGDGGGTMYDDSGTGFAYERGKSTRTDFRQRRSSGTTELTIRPARGGFETAPRKRSYEIRLAGVPRPNRVTVAGKRVGTWRYRTRSRTAIIQTGPRSTARSTRIGVGSAP